MSDREFFLGLAAYIWPIAESSEQNWRIFIALVRLGDGTIADEFMGLKARFGHVISAAGRKAISEARKREYAARHQLAT